VAAILAAGLTSAPPSHAVIYESAPSPFCDGEVLHDYLVPLKRMPRLHSPPPSGRIGFGPASIAIRPYPALLVGEGRVGYGLSLRRRTPAAHPRWDVTTTLSRVDWQGRAIEMVDRVRRQVNTVGRGHSAGVHFKVGDDPGAYRLTSVFRSRSGQKLGGYGFYFRVVAPTQNVRLGLNADSYRPGNTVFGRIENYGTATVNYGVAYSIERLNGSSWSQAPESPRGPWILIGLSTQAGQSGRCLGFWIPNDMSPGTYRVVKSVDFASGHGRSNPTMLTAEFAIAP
jgi:hypothetical protein